MNQNLEALGRDLDNARSAGKSARMRVHAIEKQLRAATICGWAAIVYCPIGKPAACRIIAVSNEVLTHLKVGRTPFRLKVENDELIVEILLGVEDTITFDRVYYYWATG